ncbi:hypothetical protein BGW80DRAFT_1490077 [Lactifluus volemus]|nr:hypothetical protein BGW80DRAFT_1490077 [Lactifluus volemus]
MASFTKWPISSPMTTAIYMNDSHEQTAISMMEARPLVFAYALAMANWRNPYPKRRRRRTEKNGIGDLSKSLRNDFTNVEHDRELGLKSQLPQITARVTLVSNIANYLKNQYAQKKSHAMTVHPTRDKKRARSRDDELSRLTSPKDHKKEKKNAL